MTALLRRADYPSEIAEYLTDERHALSSIVEAMKLAKTRSYDELALTSVKDFVGPVRNP